MQNISGTTGKLASPDYPGNYPNNVNFTWILTTGDPAAKVTFTFDEFDIYKYKWHQCTDDFLEVRFLHLYVFLTCLYGGEMCACIFYVYSVVRYFIISSCVKILG
jgi:hypothetical protein